MALVKGICKNFGECDLADNKEVQEVEKTNFVCEECGKPLHPVEGKPTSPGGGGGGKGISGKLIGIIAVAVILLGGGGFGIWKLLDKPKDFKISLDKKELILKPGERALLKASSEPKDMKLTYTWKSNDEKVATVNKGGEVRALKGGKTQIILSTEENNMLKVRCTVKVEEETGPKPIQEINVSENALEMTVGETKQISFTANPQPNDDNVLFEVSDESIISFDGSGTVKALKAGNATITFSAEKGNASAKVEVTVVEKKEPDGKGGKDGNTPGQVNLGYGIYEGPRKNYKADGFGGEIRFTRSYTIDLKKSSGETVEVGSGDKMVNVKMKDNRIMQGLLKRADGSQRQIIIG